MLLATASHSMSDSLFVQCSVLFAECKAMSAFNMASLNVSFALISMSASRLVRAFCAVCAADALLPKCLTRFLQLDMEWLKKNWVIVSLFA